MKTDIHLLYSVLGSENLDIVVKEMILQLPDNMRTRALRYKSALASNQFTIGRYLLRDGLKQLGRKDSWTSISYSERGKPILPNTIFNISHSNGIVLCAFSSSGEIGVDVEMPQDTDVQSLRHGFTVSEWKSIQNDPDQLYRLWCRKEAVLKAADVSLQSLHKVEVDSFSDQIYFNRQSWFIQSLDFLKRYNSYGAICTQYAIEKFVVEQVYF